MKVLLSTIAGWLGGVATYLVVLRLVYGQTVSNGDLPAVLLWSALAFAAAVPLIYLPAFDLLKWALGEYRPLTAFLTVGLALGIAPTVFVVYAFGGNITSLLEPEAMLFYSCFGTGGVIFGAILITCRARASTHPR